MQRNRKGLLRVYESIVIFKNLPKDELLSSVKRTTDYIFAKEGVFRDISYLGLRELPFRMTKSREPQYEANYLYFEFNVPPDSTRLLAKEMEKDRDIIRFSFEAVPYPQQPYDFESCTFADEMKPVPERPEVMEYVARAKRLYEWRHRKDWKPNSNCYFYPFQR